MSDTLQIILAVVFLVVVFFLTRWGAAVRLRRAALFIVRDLEARGATDPEHAAAVPYEKADFLKVGMRDFRPRALQEMVSAGLVRRTETGGYYLAKPENLSNH